MKVVAWTRCIIGGYEGEVVLRVGEIIDLPDASAIYLIKHELASAVPDFEPVVPDVESVEPKVVVQQVKTVKRPVRKKA